METELFEKLLVKTAFSCMVCDGEIDKKEMDLIKSIFKDFTFAQNANVEEIINQFVKEINVKGADFLLSYFKEIKVANLNEQEELKLIDYALKMIYSDFEVKYSEIKFFKIIRSKLKVSNETIIASFPSNEIFLEKSFEIIRESLPNIDQFLEEDIVTDNYVEKLMEDYFKNSTLPQFEVIQSLDNKLFE